jgi:hypothetical protein
MYHMHHQLMVQSSLNVDLSYHHYFPFVLSSKVDLQTEMLIVFHLLYLQFLYRYYLLYRLVEL